MNFYSIFRFLVAFCFFSTVTTRGLWEECLDISQHSIFTNILPIERKCQVKSWVECHKMCLQDKQDYCNSYTFFQDGGFCRLYASNNRSILQHIESDINVMTVKLKEPCFLTRLRPKRANQMRDMMPYPITGPPMKTTPPSTCGPGGCPPTAPPGFPSACGPGGCTTQPTLQVATPAGCGPGGCTTLTPPPGSPTTCGPGGCPATARAPITAPPDFPTCGPEGCITGDHASMTDPGAMTVPGTITDPGAVTDPGSMTTPETMTDPPFAGGDNATDSLVTDDGSNLSSDVTDQSAINVPTEIFTMTPGTDSGMENSSPSSGGQTSPIGPVTDPPLPGTKTISDRPITQPLFPGAQSTAPNTDPSTAMPGTQTMPVNPATPDTPVNPDTPVTVSGSQTSPYIPDTPGPAPVAETTPPQQPYVPNCCTTQEPPATAPPTPPPKWMEWSPWGSCSRMCGTGMAVRQRVCSEAAGCEGCTNEMKICNPQSCCNEWSAWSPCSVTCGQGIQKRTKRCSIESPELPGGFGSKEMSETQCCKGAMATCSQWSPWQPWNPCSVSCGGGQHVRIRSCEPTPGTCPGPSNETDSCNSKPCPVWSPWGAWTPCSDTCGSGVQFRSRVCPDGTTCPGDSKEKQDCNSVMCPHWAQWTDWGFCSQSCNGGVSERSRACLNDEKFCVGPNANKPECMCGISNDKNVTSQPCNNVKCPVPNNWEEWSNCTKPCGGGARTRNRPCVIDQSYCTQEKMMEKVCMCPNTKEETQTCNTQSCAFWSEWSPWSDCSVSCGNGTLTRKRTCNNDKTICVGDMAVTEPCNCPGNDTDSQPCDAGPCYTWSSWSKWSECTVLCGGGSRNRTRRCPIEDACPGLNDITDICNMIPCPDWSDWSPWSDCTESCGGGQRSRTRACPIPGACSPGEEYEFDAKPCNPEKCPEWAVWSPWGKCSRTCGQGNRARSRICAPVSDGCLGSGDNVEPCMMMTCTVSTEWSRWSPCTQTCGGGMRTRSRVKCPSGPPICPIEQNTSKCNDQPCPLWSNWGPWGQCSKTCGGGQRIRSRTCPVVNGCLGQNSEIDPVPCNNFGCKH